MEPISAIASAAGLLFGLLAWWLKRRVGIKSSPVEQHRKEYEAIDQAIRTGEDGGDFDRQLSELERMRLAAEAGNRAGRGDDPRGEGANDGRAK